MPIPRQEVVPWRKHITEHAIHRMHEAWFGSVIARQIDEAFCPSLLTVSS